MSYLFQRILIGLFAGALLVIAAWSSYNIYRYSSEVAEIKKDYMRSTVLLTEYYL